MYKTQTDIALGILNNVIWALYQKGYHLAAILIETLRDEEASKMSREQIKARLDRQERYEVVNRIYKRLKHTPVEYIAEVAKLKTLEKVFLCMVTNAVKLRQFDKPADLYNALAYSYLYTFEGWRDGDAMAKSDLYKFRATLDTVARCVRHVKADHPFMFNDVLIKNSSDTEDEAIETHGNSLV